uniref:Uncharacterized protein n=1 Tax=Rhizophora mucronata TaxID=61149 RepID=A0A2P2IH43_RHIMU
MLRASDPSPAPQMWEPRALGHPFYCFCFWFIESDMDLINIG